MGRLPDSMIGHCIIVHARKNVSDIHLPANPMLPHRLLQAERYSERLPVPGRMAGISEEEEPIE
jgi:hypothetical protein